MKTTVVFGAGIRSGGNAPVVLAEPSKQDLPAPEPESKEWFVLRVTCGAFIITVMSSKREELDDLIKIRRYPEDYCKIWPSIFTSPLAPSAREISILALYLDDHWDKRLFKNGLLHLGEIMDAGPHHLLRIGFDGSEIAVIRRAMAKHGLELPLLRPKKRAKIYDSFGRLVG